MIKFYLDNLKPDERFCFPYLVEQQIYVSNAKPVMIWIHSWTYMTYVTYEKIPGWSIIRMACRIVIINLPCFRVDQQSFVKVYDYYEPKVVVDQQYKIRTTCGTKEEIPYHAPPVGKDQNSALLLKYGYLKSWITETLSFLLIQWISLTLFNRKSFYPLCWMFRFAKESFVYQVVNP